ncbi:MAG TPA: hypothetical protein VIR38_08450 [Thalassobaculum sp.]
MPRLSMLIAAALVLLTGAEAQAAAKCEPDTLSKTLRERLNQDGKTDAQIRDILGSSFKRKVLAGRVADGSGCTAEQTDQALKTLEAALAQG